MSLPDRAPGGVELDRPNAARMYDYLVGRSHNFDVDRRAAAATAVWRPDAPDELFVDEPGRCPGYAGVGRKP